MCVGVGVCVCVGVHLIYHTECVRDLDKLNLVKFGYGGLGLGSSQFLLLPQLPL